MEIMQFISEYQSPPCFGRNWKQNIFFFPTDKIGHKVKQNITSLIFQILFIINIYSVVYNFPFSYYLRRTAVLNSQQFFVL